MSLIKLNFFTKNILVSISVSISIDSRLGLKPYVWKFSGLDLDLGLKKIYGLGLGLGLESYSRDYITVLHEGLEFLYNFL